MTVKDFLYNKESVIMGLNDLCGTFNHEYIRIAPLKVLNGKEIESIQNDEIGYKDYFYYYIYIDTYKINRLIFELTDELKSKGVTLTPMHTIDFTDSLKEAIVEHFKDFYHNDLNIIEFDWYYTDDAEEIEMEAGCSINNIARLYIKLDADE